MKYKTSFTNKFEKPVLDFGKMPLGNGFIEKKDFKKDRFHLVEIGPRFVANIIGFKIE